MRKLLFCMVGILGAAACWGAESVYSEVMPLLQQVSLREGSVPVSALASPQIARGKVKGAPATTADQAYEITVGRDGVKVVAGGAAGERYAKVTLDQLAKLSGGREVPCAKVADWPVLRWRGVMNDCGRNFLALEGVKAMVDLCGKYKLNLFHWHLADYHGWRLESKRYPKLSAPETMTRQLGKFYTQEEFKEVVAYAAERGVTVMPELDVPGHTLALRKGLGVETMRDPRVDKAVSDLLDELCGLAPKDAMPFVHLGTDEVRVDPEYVDAGQCSRWAETLAKNGRITVCWAPGQKMACSGEVVDMAWYDNHVTNSANRAFDTARMYFASTGPELILNQAAFLRPCRWDVDPSRKLGAVACSWHDDHVGEDTLRLFANATIAPATLLFADNYWHGVREDNPMFLNHLPSLDDPALEISAKRLERRLLAQRDKVIADFPYAFPYVAQCDQHWRVSDAKGTILDGHYTGGLIDARAFTPKSCGEVVAETWVFSPKAQTVGAWIGFGKTGSAYSRSEMQPMPKRGEWCIYGSSVEVNGEKVAPPDWKKPGAKAVAKLDADGKSYKGATYSSDLCETPLEDEWYFIREPSKVSLREGWNHVKLVIRNCKPGATRGRRSWRGVFRLLEGTSAHPREVPGLRWSSDPQPNGLRPLDLPGLIAAAKPGETVRVAAGEWETKPFRLKSGVTLALDEGAVVYASTNIEDYAAAEGQRYFIGAVDAEDIAIVGKGVFDGRGQLFQFTEHLVGESQPQKLPVMMRFIRCRNVRLEGFTYRNGGAWGCHLCNCDGVTVRKLTCFNHSNRTNDGIDIESRNVLIEDCDIDADDDAIVLKTETDKSFAVTNVLIRNCRLASSCNAYKFGTGSYCDFRDVTLENCTFARPRGNYIRGKRERRTGNVGQLTGIAGMAIEVNDGGRMENVVVRNVTVEGYLTPVFVRLERRRPPAAGRETYMRNVLIENVKGTADSRLASSITGVPGLKPDGIVLRNCDFTFPGGGTADLITRPVPEKEKAYPDCTMFDRHDLPAWGFYVRHAKNVRFENVTCRLKDADAREKYVFDDAEVTVTEDLVHVKVDFGDVVGKIRPALHSSGFGASMMRGVDSGRTADKFIREMNFHATRTHDWSLINSGQRIVDWYHLFPLPHLDAKDPKNYCFKPTDRILQLQRDLGLNILYRLGPSIEHTGTEHFNALVPADFDKVAESFAATVRHYNRGWADGFDWNIAYWEIWNEPDGLDTLWCKPGVSWESKAKMRDEYIRFFITCYKRLKGEFPEIKVGGPGLCDYDEKGYLVPLLEACRREGVQPDFISWHDYCHDPQVLLNQAAAMKKLCTKYGFDKTELFIDEWHFLPKGGFAAIRSTDPKVSGPAKRGPHAINGIDSACFTLTALVGFQSSALDQAYFYGCRHTGSWGFRDEEGNLNKNFYALKAFGSLVKNYAEFCRSASDDSRVRAFPVRAADGALALLVVDYCGDRRRIELDIANGPAMACPKAELLSDACDLKPVDVIRRDGKIVLEKPDEYSAAFLLKF